MEMRKKQSAKNFPQVGVFQSVIERDVL